jgi:Rrf2 family iron-sulfur cluster assembly transcriptional regulator
MLSLSRRLFYALEAVLTLAYREKQTPMSGKELCERLGLPPRALEAMMQQLVRTGVLRGQRGPSGGYMLAKPESNITLSELCLALEDGSERAETSTPLGTRVLSPLCDKMERMSLSYLETITLAQLCENATKAGLAREGASAMDFTI